MIISNAAVDMSSQHTYSQHTGFSYSKIRVGAFDENMACARAKAGQGEYLGGTIVGAQADCVAVDPLVSGNYTKFAQLLYDATGLTGSPTSADAKTAEDAADKVDADGSGKTGTDTAASSVDSAKQADSTMSLSDFSTRMQFSILRYILQLLYGKVYDPETEDGLSGETLGDKADSFLQTCVYDVTAASFTYSEEEATSFSTTGTVQTADGRNLSFNLNISMTRSFSASYDAMSARQAILQDPLIIRTDEDVPADASISDQTFIFDIDGDGKEEEVQNLAAGCGFLAIDQNNNGRIDNGTELFGARSGNGFADLAEYDSDGNGWIDEADDVWSKLCIYTVDSDGAEHMQSLKDADVGAIYLGSAPTEFTKTGDDGISVYGKMRRSGFFLHESTGSAGAMQQVDLGVRNPKFKDYNSIPTTIEESLDTEAAAV